MSGAPAPQPQVVAGIFRSCRCSGPRRPLSNSRCARSFHPPPVPGPARPPGVRLRRRPGPLPPHASARGSPQAPSPRPQRTLPAPRAWARAGGRQGRSLRLRTARPPLPRSLCGDRGATPRSPVSRSRGRQAPGDAARPPFSSGEEPASVRWGPGQRVLPRGRDCPGAETPRRRPGPEPVSHSVRHGWGPAGFDLFLFF